MFVDPKGLERFNSKVKSKVNLHKRIKDTERKIQEKYNHLFLHSYVWSTTAPKDIGSDVSMTKQDCQDQGIFLASEKMEGIKNLLQSALK